MDSGIWQRLTDWDRSPVLNYFKRRRAERLIGSIRTNDEKGIRSELAGIGEPAVPVLIGALRNKNPDVRRAAGWALIKIGDCAVQDLITVLEDPNRYARRAAVSVLGEIGDSTMISLLSTFLKDEDHVVRMLAADSLGWIEDPSAVPALLDALKDKDRFVRKDAARALEKIRDASALPALINALDDDDRDARTWVELAIGKIYEQADTVEKIEKLEAMVKEGVATLATKDERTDAIMKIAKLMKRASDKKNGLASKRDILLDDRPKPPKRGKIYQAAKRVRYG